VPTPSPSAGPVADPTSVPGSAGGTHRARRVGILALQGAFREHGEVVNRLGAQAVEVRVASDLDGIDALVLPGGESTTMSLLLGSSGLWDAVAKLLVDGLPVLATCAGLILLARQVDGGRPDQRSFGVLDVRVARNGYGRQIDSFETDLTITGIEGDPFPAVFIRAPVITATGAEVDVLASVDEHPVLIRQGPVLATTFHPELSGDLRLHDLFLGGM
jgi:5'-phosphate synthase pdxT subunit